MSAKKTLDKAIKMCDTKKYMLRVYSGYKPVREEFFDDIDKAKRKYLEYKERYGKYNAPYIYENKEGNWIRLKGF